LKAKAKYYLSRFVILLLAVRILDVSIDIDFATASSPISIVENYDDVDSISEFILEKIFDNDHLVAESNNDDHRHDNHKLAGYSCVFFYVEPKNDFRVSPDFQLSVARPFSLKNTLFHFEDHSLSLYTPPDLLTATTPIS
jgi:hypothetical protein